MLNVKGVQNNLINEMLKTGVRKSYYIGGYYLEYNEAYEITKNTINETFDPFVITYLLKSCDNEILKKVEVAGKIYIVPTNKYLESKKSKFN